MTSTNSLARDVHGFSISTAPRRGRFFAGSRRRRLGQCGTTLVESVVALGLLAAGAATTGNFLVQQIRRGGNNGNYTTAYALAAESLESMRAKRFADMEGSESTLRQGSVVFHVTTQVSDGHPAPNLKQITVTVTWKDPSGSNSISVPVLYTEISGA